jgi:hypothetical protein
MSLLVSEPAKPTTSKQRFADNPPFRMADAPNQEGLPLLQQRLDCCVGLI